MEQGPRRLVVIRHAKAEQNGPTDYDRRLTTAGAEDARAAGEWLASRGLVPDLALVSAAVRAEETWDEVAEGAGWELPPSLDEGLYAAGTETALDIVRATSEEVRTLVVVGHNPTIASLAQLLDDGEGDPEASSALVTGYPTSTVAVFEYDDDWGNLDEASARVVAFHVARAERA